MKMIQKMMMKTGEDDYNNYDSSQNIWHIDLIVLIELKYFVLTGHFQVKLTSDSFVSCADNVFVTFDDFQ